MSNAIIKACLFLIFFFCFGLASSKCKLDLGLVVDTTKSIGLQNSHFLKNSLKRLIQIVGVSQNGSHVSFETFAADSVLHNKFNDAHFYSSKAMEALVDEGINRLTKPTRLDYGIFKANDEMFIPESGVRAGVRSVMVLFTDGKTHPNTMDYEGAVQSLKVRHGSMHIITRKEFRAILNFTKF